jgi:hypothetical protein
VSRPIIVTPHKFGWLQGSQKLLKGKPFGNEAGTAMSGTSDVNDIEIVKLDEAI